MLLVRQATEIRFSIIFMLSQTHHDLTWTGSAAEDAYFLLYSPRGSPRSLVRLITTSKLATTTWLMTCNYVNSFAVSISFVDLDSPNQGEYCRHQKCALCLKIN